jgi:CRP-like cAMP-binding protein
VATIPNSIVARSQIINRSVPTQRRAASIDIPTLSTARSEQLMDLARQAILLCPAILPQPEPSVLIKHIGTRTTTIGVNYFVATTPALGQAKSQLLRQVRRLFRQAGVQDGQPATPASVLANLVLFESLSAPQIDALAAQLITRRFDPGDALFEAGSVGQSLYVIRSGIFGIVGTDNHAARPLRDRIGPGEYIGEISMMTGDPRPVTVAALTAGEVLELPRGALETLLKEDKQLSAAMERSVRRGLALIDRDSAARNCHPLDPGGSLLQRIRGFLHARPA